MFYGQQLYGTYSSNTPFQVTDLPDGAYAKSYLGYWYLVLNNGLTPINLSDIPPEVRLNCLLMGIPV